MIFDTFGVLKIWFKSAIRVCDLVVDVCLFDMIGSNHFDQPPVISANYKGLEK